VVTQKAQLIPPAQNPTCRPNGPLRASYELVWRRLGKTNPMGGGGAKSDHHSGATWSCHSEAAGALNPGQPVD
jgi:hypothetical protein